MRIMGMARSYTLQIGSDSESLAIFAGMARSYGTSGLKEMGTCTILIQNGILQTTKVFNQPS